MFPDLEFINSSQLNLKVDNCQSHCDNVAKLYWEIFKHLFFQAYL